MAWSSSVGNPCADPGLHTFGAGQGEWGQVLAIGRLYAAAFWARGGGEEMGPTTLTAGALPVRIVNASDDWTRALAIATVTISVVAIVTTLVIAYVNSWRRARVEVVDVAPRAYGAQLDPHGTQDRIFIRIPIVFRNRGAKTGVVTDLRLSGPPEWRRHITGVPVAEPSWMSWDGMGASDLESDKAGDVFARPLLIGGRDATVVNCRFRYDIDGPTFNHATPGTVAMTLQARTLNRRPLRNPTDEARRWLDVQTFELSISARAKNGLVQKNLAQQHRWWAHWNTPHGGPPD
jgi:hypothetical protein